MKLVKGEDLGIPQSNLFMRALTKVLFRILSLDKLNKVYESSEHLKGAEFATNALDYIGIIRVHQGLDLRDIPNKGGVIVIVNHPTGAADGMVLMELLSKVRKDVKFMGNFLLSKIKPLSEFFIEVDPFTATNSRNLSGIKQSLDYVKNGGMLVVFPAGEISTYQRGFRYIADKPWPNSILKFIASCESPILPIHIEAKNSFMFHLLGKIHPILRTIQIPKELVNKKGHCFKMAVGSLIDAQNIKEHSKITDLGRFLRLKLYDLIQK